MPSVTTIPATFDGTVLKPDAPLELSPNSRVMVAIYQTDADGDASAWSEEDNVRRCLLIDKDIQGGITVAERLELEILQSRFDRYLDEVAPVPLEGALRLHRELVAKQGKREDA